MQNFKAMRTTSPDGCEIAFEVVGYGHPLLLLHGFSQSRELWTRFGWQDRLQQRYQVITIDLRGCGQSDAPLDASRYSIKDHMADIDAVMAELEIKSCAIWGWSFGGTLGLHLAKRGTNLSYALISGTYFGKLFTEEFVAKRLSNTADPLTRVRWQGLQTWPEVVPDDIRCPMSIYSGTDDGNVVIQLEKQRKDIEKAGIEFRVFAG